LDPELLRRVVENEVARLDWQNPEVVGYLSRYPEYRPEAMLRLLVFGYAIQEFESEGIAIGCRKDRGFQALCDGIPVPAQDLIKFRRANRPLIEAVLGRVFETVASSREGGSAVECGSAGEDPFLREARRRLDIARHFDTQD
jgi:transposase